MPAPKTGSRLGLPRSVRDPPSYPIRRNCPLWTQTPSKIPGQRDATKTKNVEVSLWDLQHSATLGYLQQTVQGEGFENLHGEDEAPKHCPILAPPAATAEEALLAEAAGATAGLFLLLLRRRVARRILRGLWKGLSSEGNTIGIVCLTRLTVEWRASSLDSESDKWVRARQSPISLFEVLTKIFSSRHR